MADKKIVMFHPYVAEGAALAVENVIKSRWIGQGHLVAEFETLFREKTGAPFAAAVYHVSSAIRLALSIAGIGPGDEVITTPQTCTATNHPILEQFAVPVFADIEYLSGNIDPFTIERRITPKTKAIICSHWGGYPCEIDHVHAIAKAHNLTVIEDASDALGATCKGRPIGTISPFTCFCFQAIQQVTASEGGILATTEEKTFLAAQRRRWFGIDRINRTPNNIGYYDFDVWETGCGCHMTNIAAAIGLANLGEMDAILARRKQIASLYRKELAAADGVTLFHNKEDRESAWQLFSIHVPLREDFCRAMRSRGVETSIVHNRNDIYSVFGGRRDDLPVLDSFSKTFICIPLHNQLTDEQVGRVIASIRKGW